MRGYENKLIDLHLHMDGSISLQSAKSLAALQGISLPASDSEIASMLMVTEDCRDLNEYLARFDFPLYLLQTEEALELATANLMEELKEEGYLYAEIRFAPQSHGRKGMTQRQAVEAVLRGVQKIGFPCGVILCCMRGTSNEKENAETLALCKEYLGRGVVALDLAGAEALFPNASYSSLFQMAAEQQIPMTIHAGEAAGPESIWPVLSSPVSRLGHGIRSVEDEKLLDHLKNSQTNLELCPTSNLNTNMYSSLEQYPIRVLLDHNIHVTINSDNRSVSNTKVQKEFDHLLDAGILAAEDVTKLLIHAAEASFASEEMKQYMKRKILLDIL